MRAVVQRVADAAVVVEGKTVGEIGRGYLVFLGIAEGDTKERICKLAEKIAKLRIFADEAGKTNLAAADVAGEILVVSQFTLMAECSGNRPSFSAAAKAGLATELYEYFLTCCEGKYQKIAAGIFGADMSVSLINDGPFTIILEDKDIK